MRSYSVAFAGLVLCTGVADVLTGAHRPTGRLSFTWPRSMAQIPINIGDVKYDPLYPYGFGLTY